MILVKCKILILFEWLSVMDQCLQRPHVKDLRASLGIIIPPIDGRNSAVEATVMFYISCMGSVLLFKILQKCP